MSLCGERFCFVTIYSPDRHDLGGSGWIDRRLLEAFRAAGADVAVVAVAGPPSRREHSGFTIESAGQVPLEIRGDARSLVRVGAGMLVGREPYMSRKFTAFPGWKGATDLLRARAADRVLVTSGWAGLVLADGAGCHVDVHIAHNVESVLAATHSPLPLRLLGEQTRMLRAEHRMLSAASRVVALSRSDAAALSSRGVPTDMLPLPLLASSPPCGTGSRRAVGFIGKAGWPPNARALQTLLGPVHDELTRRGVDVPLILAGSGTEEHLGHPRVVRAGRVESVDEFYRDVGLVAVPRFGASTGVSVKMLEAAEFGVPAVAPAALANAIDPSGPWYVAEDPESTADAIIRWSRGDGTVVSALQWVTRQRSDMTLAVLAGRPTQDVERPSSCQASSGTNPESP